MIRIYDIKGENKPEYSIHSRNGWIYIYNGAGAWSGPYKGIWKKIWICILAKLILSKWWFILSWHHLKIQFKRKAKIYGRINRNN